MAFFSTQLEDKKEIHDNIMLIQKKVTGIPKIKSKQKNMHELEDYRT